MAPGTSARVCSSSLTAREEAKAPDGLSWPWRSLGPEQSHLGWRVAVAVLGPWPSSGRTHSPSGFSFFRSSQFSPPGTVAGRGQAGMSRLLCVPGGCPPALWVRPLQSTVFRHWHKVQWGPTLRGSKCLLDMALFKWPRDPGSCWPRSCLQGPSQPVCPNTPRRRADCSPALTGDAKNPLIKIILSRAFF